MKPFLILLTLLLVTFFFSLAPMHVSALAGQIPVSFSATESVTPGLTKSPIPVATDIPVAKGVGPWDAIPPMGENDFVEPHSSKWFRFEYGGDKTAITIVVDNGGAPQQEFALYTADQVAAIVRGEKASPLGRGALNKGATGHDLFWTGNTNGMGIYFVVVSNNSDRAVFFRLVVAGPSVFIKTSTPPRPVLVNTATPVPQSTPSPILRQASTPTSTPTSTPMLTATAIRLAPVTITPQMPTETRTRIPTVPPTPTAAGAGPLDAIIPIGQDLIINPHSSKWHRFEYGGDKTTITIAVDNGGATQQEFALYMSSQVDAMFRGETISPLGRGGGNPAATGHDLFWTGNTNRLGTYYVVVTNNSNNAVAYRLTVTGPSVFTKTSIPPTPTPIPNLFQDIVKVGITDLATEFPVYFPIEYGRPPLIIKIPARPTACTPPEAVPAVITQTMVLCEDSVYSNLHLVGTNIGLFGDKKRSAVVKGEGRSFAITAEGDNLLLHGIDLLTSTAPEDKGKWLCAFGSCNYQVDNKFWTVKGGPAYGGGVLLRANGSVVSSISVKGGGTVGIAVMGGRNNVVINSHFDRMTGWGAYSDEAIGTYYLGNTFNLVNRDCVSPDGVYYSSGCETAGWFCSACQDNIVAENQCAKSGNCYYASGDGGRPSQGNKFYGNYCFGSPNNCFEVTFSKGNEFENNVTTRDPITGENCNFPFWIGGSSVRFGRNNNWGCIVSAQRAIELSQASTSVATEVNK